MYSGIYPNITDQLFYLDLQLCNWKWQWTNVNQIKVIQRKRSSTLLDINNTNSSIAIETTKAETPDQI